MINKKVYIEIGDNNQIADISQYNAFLGFSSLGFEVILYTIEDLYTTIKIKPEDVFVGNVVNMEYVIFLTARWNEIVCV